MHNIPFLLTHDLKLSTALITDKTIECNSGNNNTGLYNAIDLN